MSRNGYLAALVALATVAGLVSSPWASAFNIYTVGGDAACNFAFIQDAIDAAAANPGEDYVWIASNRVYEDQHLIVTDQDVDIEGGFTDCSDFDPGDAQTTIGGISGHSVLEIEGASHVYLGNMVITGGDLDGDHSGGGIYFGGSGSLELRTTTVTGNNAGYGAGIDMNGGSGPATLTLDDNLLIISNSASVSGGGIRLEGNARLLALRPQTLIAFNHAPNGYGGGIEVIGPAQADIASSGYAAGAVLQFNDANYGGGIAAIAPDQDENAVVRIFSVDADNSVSVANNVAASNGGGIYLKSHVTPTLGHGNATFCASEFRIDDNVAQEGSAIYADSDSFLDQPWGSTVLLNRDVIAGDVCSLPEPISALGAVACTVGTRCNEFDANVTADLDGNPTAGASILVQNAGYFEGTRFSATSNVGAHVMRTVADGGPITVVSDCLLAKNDLSQEIIAITDGTDAALSVTSCTIADNQVGAPYVMLVGDFTALTDSIVEQPDRATIDAAGEAPDVSYVLSNDVSTLGNGPGIVQGTPTFVDEINGDFHLVDTSLGIDAAPDIDGFDRDGQPRTVDLTCVTNGAGSLDLGAYEMQACGPPPDEIFNAGFENVIP